MKKLARIAAAGVTVGVLSVVGLSSAASAYSIYNTGPFSNNGIYSTRWNNYWDWNNNNIGVSNFNTQTAVTGNAYVGWNTFGGSAITGAASNWNNTSTNVSVWNY